MKLEIHIQWSYINIIVDKAFHGRDKQRARNSSD